jgi:hypothetical protein
MVNTSRLYKILIKERGKQDEKLMVQNVFKTVKNALNKSIDKTERKRKAKMTQLIHSPDCLKRRMCPVPTKGQRLFGFSKSLDIVCIIIN